MSGTLYSPDIYFINIYLLYCQLKSCQWPQNARHICGPYLDDRHKIYVLSSGLSDNIFFKSLAKSFDVLNAIFLDKSMSRNAQNVREISIFRRLRDNLTDRMQHSGGLPVTHVPIKRLQNINTHRQLIHEAKKYPCDHQASSIGNITTHKQSIHEWSLW